MIERVARAIYAAEGNKTKPVGGEWRASSLDDEDQESRSLYFDYARAAIEAIRVPTEGMVSAMRRQGFLDVAQEQGALYLLEADAVNVFRSGINAALDEKSK